MDVLDGIFPTSKIDHIVTMKKTIGEHGMRKWIVIGGAMIVGGVAGCIGLTILTLLLHWILIPQVLVYWLAPLITIPAGAFLGSITSIIIFLKEKNYNKKIGILYTISSIITITFICMFLYDFRTDGAFLFYFISLPFLWAILLFVLGIILLCKSALLHK